MLLTACLRSVLRLGRSRSFGTLAYLGIILAILTTESGATTALAPDQAIATSTADAIPTAHAAAAGEATRAPEPPSTRVSALSIAIGALALAVFLAGANRFSKTGMQRWTINSRLAAGFASTLVLLTALAVESYVSLRYAFVEFSEFRANAQRTAVGAGIQTEFLEMRIAAKDLVITRSPEASERYRQHKETVVGHLKAAQATVTEQPLLQKLKVIESNITRHAELQADLLRAVERGQTADIAKLDLQIGELGTLINAEAYALETTFLAKQNEAGPRITAEIQHTLSVVIWLGLAAIVIGFCVATIIARSINGPLRNLAESLGAGADQTSSAASQVSAASKSLAEGATEQAASLEETSASLEELTSMTKSNAENAKQAMITTSVARSAAETGAVQMQSMQVAMEAIRTASADITTILKTIDEIAFQTNILALNAAVESARAGEHGMGFAVVAEEVRALAQRSAAAAKETGSKIEESTDRSERGLQLSAEVAASFTNIQVRIQQLDAAVTEIANASREQSEGISQVTAAVSQMDKVTQTNAGSAEETATSAEDLNRQSLALHQAVTELKLLTGGRPPRKAVSQSKAAGKGARPATLRHPAAAHPRPASTADAA